MPWFKVDDGFHAHRKVIRAGVPALGLWVVAGSWCADQLTDGFVPDYVAQRLDPDFEAHAAALVAAKLWVAGEKDGEPGWYFHQWSDEGRQPTAESVNAKRDDARERMAKLRAERAEASRNKKSGSQDVRANASRTSGEVASTPTRPDPTISKEIEEPPSAPPPSQPKKTSAKAKTEAEHPHFAEFWAAYPLKIGKGKAREAFGKAIANGADPERLIASASRFTRHLGRVQTERKFIPHPTSWLNGERWEDDLDDETPPAVQPPLMPDWCGHCDPNDRTVEHADGRWANCPTCHPDAERTNP